MATPAATVHTMVKDRSRLPPGDPSKMAAIIVDGVNQDPAPKRIVPRQRCLENHPEGSQGSFNGRRGTEGSRFLDRLPNQCITEKTYESVNQFDTRHQ